MHLVVKIRSEKGVYEFNLCDSPYASFAEIIINGVFDWDIDVSQASTDATAESLFRINGWIQVSENILAHIQAEGFDQVAYLLGKSNNPCDTLDQLVNS